MKYLIVILSSIVILSNGQQPGGKKDLDVHSQDVIEMTKFAFEKIELASNSIYKHKMGEIIKAQSQVVQGTMYFITFEFHETSCKKNQNDKDVPCDVTKTEICDVEVWSRKWMKENSTQIHKFSCKIRN